MTFSYRIHVGPCAVGHCADKLASANIPVSEGTEHIYGKIVAPSQSDAADSINAALGFKAADARLLWRSEEAQ